MFPFLAYETPWTALSKSREMITEECLMKSHCTTKFVDITFEFRLLRNIDVLGQSFTQSS
jgi:hypothetical protein